MKILKLNNSTFDVFTGIGWHNWSRWHRAPNGFLTQVTGDKVVGKLKNDIIARLA